VRDLPRYRAVFRLPATFSGGQRGRKPRAGVQAWDDQRGALSRNAPPRGNVRLGGGAFAFCEGCQTASGSRAVFPCTGAGPLPAPLRRPPAVPSPSMETLIWAMLAGILALCFVCLLVIAWASVQTLYTVRDLRSAALAALSADE
jgi:hypothetical protein